MGTPSLTAPRPSLACFVYDSAFGRDVLFGKVRVTGSVRHGSRSPIDSGATRREGDSVDRRLPSPLPLPRRGPWFRRAETVGWTRLPAKSYDPTVTVMPHVLAN